MKYVVIYEWTGRNYSAYAPDLPGCVAAGDTLEETQELMKDAIALYIDELKREGQPVPLPKTKANTLTVTA